jgi:hypothetical protein
MKQLTFAIAMLCMGLVACKKNNDTIPDCEVVPNDTLMLTYPCDGQTDFDEENFSWQFGAVGKQLAGTVEIHVKSAGTSFWTHSSAVWHQMNDANAQTSITESPIELLSHTTYEWYIVMRNDNEGLYFITPVRTFTTGDTGLDLPAVFQSFAGNFTVQDTFYEKIQVWDTQHTYHYEDVPPASRGTTTLALALIAGENYSITNDEAVTHMHLRIGQDTLPYRVEITSRGEFSWTDGSYHSPMSIIGAVIGDSIVCSLTRRNNMSPVYWSHSYKGKR